MDINGVLTVDKLPDINQGENISVGILTVIDESFLAKQPTTVRYYFEFETADGQKFVSAPTAVQQGVLSCSVKNSVLGSCGEAHVQIVAVDSASDYVFKSTVACFYVGQSINATDRDFVGDDLLSQLNKIITDMTSLKEKLQKQSQQMQEQSNDLKNKAESGYFTGAKGDKGEKGDRGESPQVFLNNGILYAEYQN
ncbi:MAG: hypothetical protein IKA42_02225 [Clostridia bacterium]|nr:hypothetical protein [Clostridia bacterium]